jgi:hypothetical protein
VAVETAATVKMINENSLKTMKMMKTMKTVENGMESGR